MFAIWLIFCFIIVKIFIIKVINSTKLSIFNFLLPYTFCRLKAYLGEKKQAQLDYTKKKRLIFRRELFPPFFEFFCVNISMVYCEI